MAGFPSFIGQDGHVQNPTMIFRLLGVDVERFLAQYGEDTIMGEAVSALIREKSAGNEYVLPRAKIWLFPTTRPGELLCNCTRVIGTDGRELNPLFARDFTEAEIEGRRQVREYARFFRDNLIGCEASFVNDTGVQVGVRQTRQARGTHLLRNIDVLSGAKFSDGIADLRGRSSCTRAPNRGSNGCSTTSTRSRTDVLCRSEARACSRPVAVCQQSTKPLPLHASPPNASVMDTRSALLPPSARWTVWLPAALTALLFAQS